MAIDPEELLEKIDILKERIGLGKEVPSASTILTNDGERANQRNGIRGKNRGENKNIVGQVGINGGKNRRRKRKKNEA